MPKLTKNHIEMLLKWIKSMIRIILIENNIALILEAEYLLYIHMLDRQIDE